MLWLPISYPASTTVRTISGCCFAQLPVKNHVAGTARLLRICSSSGAGAASPPASKVSAICGLLGMPLSISIDETGCTPDGVSQGPGGDASATVAVATAESVACGVGGVIGEGDETSVGSVRIVAVDDAIACEFAEGVAVAA